MITAGIDIGARNVKAVVLKDGKVLSKKMAYAGINAKESVSRVYDEALLAGSLKKDDVQSVFATGAGRNDCVFAHDEITEVGAAAKGISYIMPDVRTIIVVGAEEGRAVRIDGKGNVIDFAINEKCAAGAGTFLESMARALETRVEDMADLYEQSSREISMNAQCAVFAESELVHLVHSQVSRADIARAIITAIADRVISIIRRVGIENDVAAIGGVALNKGFIKSIEKELNIQINVPADPQFVSAIGAALAAASVKPGGLAQ